MAPSRHLQPCGPLSLTAVTAATAALATGALVFAMSIQLWAGPALAGQSTEAFIVGRSDLDLSSAADRAVLDQRVFAAARAACRAAGWTGDPVYGHRRCIAETVRRTRAQVDAAVSHDLALIPVETPAPGHGRHASNPAG